LLVVEGVLNTHCLVLIPEFLSSSLKSKKLQT